jgi:hypothetical protein
MSKSSTITIACALCVGATPEAYLPAALASIAPAVDALVVNDNSGLERSENVRAIEASAFAARPLLIEAYPFVDFADMRNRAFALLARLPVRPDWVLFLDADEVHGEQLRYIARELLPRFSGDVAHVDGYTYHFFGTFGWITDIARRLMFYRYDPTLRWENAVHEKIVGLHGRSIVLPYAYHHYGNVVPPALLARKHTTYYALGNRVPEPPREEAATIAQFVDKARDVRRYDAPHPQVVRPTLDAIAAASAPTFAAIDAAFAAAEGADAPRRRLVALNEGLRVALRRLEHPLLYREATRAR